MGISDAQGNLHARDGKFTHKPTGVDNSANQALGGAPVVYRSPEAVITKPLTLEEVGYRTDKDGMVSARMALLPYEMDTISDEGNDRLCEKLAGEHGYTLGNLRIVPISVDEHSRVICEVSGETHPSDFDEDEMAQFRTGQQARARGVAPEPIAYGTPPVFDASLAAQGDDKAMHPVPELPEGFENPVIELGYNKYTSDPEIRLHWSDSIYKHCPSVDGHSDSYEDSSFGRPVTDEQMEQIDEHVRVLGLNYMIARDQVMSNLERSEKFQDAMVGRITAGGPNTEYY